MQVKKMDSHSSGFKIAPRRPHRQPNSSGKKLTRAEQKQSVRSVVMERLIKDGFIDYNLYPNKLVMKNIGSLKAAGWIIELVKVDRKPVGYKLIKQ